jgi:hypothetical protein
MDLLRYFSRSIPNDEELARIQEARERVLDTQAKKHAQAVFATLGSVMRENAQNGKDPYKVELTLPVLIYTIHDDSYQRCSRIRRYLDSLMLEHDFVFERDRLHTVYGCCFNTYEVMCVIYKRNVRSSETKL